MKFLHLGDLHLGKSLLDYDLYDDQEYILNQILDIIKSKQVDGVLIAGDVYDKSVPSEAATRLLNNFLSKLSEYKVKVFMISGNHDSDDRINYGSSLFEASDIFISATYDGKLKRFDVEDDYGIVSVYLMPFVKASYVRHFYPDVNIETYDDAIRTILANIEIDKNNRNIIVAHQFVAGESDPSIAGSEGLAVQSVGLIEKIGVNIFDDFDYVALGHIHSPQRIGRDTVRYSGSPLKYSLSEVNNDKSVPIITMYEKGRFSIELASLKPLRDVRHIRGKLKELLSEENVEHKDDYIYATLTDEDIINDTIGIFRQTYKNTVKVDYDNSHTKELEKVDISNIIENMTYTDIIGEFYRQVYGTEITEEEMDIMRDVAREAGVINEAD